MCRAIGTATRTMSAEGGEHSEDVGGDRLAVHEAAGGVGEVRGSAVTV
jgi:hypothetical protein